MGGHEARGKLALQAAGQALRAPPDQSARPLQPGLARLALSFRRGDGTALAECLAPHELRRSGKKTSTLLTMVTLSASCFAAPVHTAQDGTPASTLAERANAAPVAPAAPDVAVTDDNRPQQWQHIVLPKSRHPERGFAARNERLQT
jgi:hypothetical protein